MKNSSFSIKFPPQFWRMLPMLSLGFASGFPINISGTTLQAWYTDAGISLVGIGALTLVGIPYTYKFLWAPLMDRFVPPCLGRRRGWMLLTQLGLIIAIALMALFHPGVSPVTLSLLAVSVAFLSASQDINLDAYRTDITEPEERGLVSALWVSGWRIGALASGGLALIIADHWGWRACFLFMSALMLIGLVTTLLCKSPRSDNDVPTNLKRAVVDAFKEFFTRRYAILLLVFIIFYKFGDAVALSLSTAFYLRVLHFSLAEVGSITKMMALGATIAGTFIGGFCMLKLKLYRSLLYFGVLQAVSTLMFVWLSLVGHDIYLLAATVFAEYFTSGMATAAFFALLMSLCDHRYTATQFALLSSFSALGRVLVGPIAGFSVEYISWSWFFFISFLLAIPALLLLTWLHKRVNFDEDKVKGVFKPR